MRISLVDQTTPSSVLDVLHHQHTEGGSGHFGTVFVRGGWKCGYITCTILRCSRVWYDWNVNNAPCLACHHTLDETLRWLEVLYYTYQYLIVFQYWELKNFMYKSPQRQTARSNLGYPVGERVTLPAIVATQLTCNSSINFWAHYVVQVDVLLSLKYCLLCTKKKVPSICQKGVREGTPVQRAFMY